MRLRLLLLAFVLGTASAAEPLLRSLSGRGELRAVGAGGVVRLDDLPPGRHAIELGDPTKPVIFRLGSIEHRPTRAPYRFPLWNKKHALPPGRHVLQIVGPDGAATHVILEASQAFDPYALLWEGPRPPAGRRATDWAMHEIDTPPDPLPNGLDGADVNGDGWLDFVTNYEHGGRIRVALHPGANGDPRRPWRSVVVGYDPNAESVAFGDFDGDNRPDVVSAHGVESNNSVSGVKIIWGPAPARATLETAWTASPDIPASVNGGQYTYVRAFDLTGDGRPEIVVGGRRDGLASDGDRPYAPHDRYAGLKWYEAPENPGERRDPSKWRQHVIDEEIKGSFGFQFGDIDHDGHPDVAVTNSDWDTREPDRVILWYRNPGRADALRRPWSRHVIERTPHLFTKPQLALGDLDGDGRLDVVIQPSFEDKIWFYRNLGGDPIAWQKIEIQKPDIAAWRSRPTKIVDLDGDGRMDLVGALIHRDGRLPAAKAAMFWMTFAGDRPAGDNWKTHPIKWADGYIGAGKFVGEKWDQVMFHDVDRDGDLDIVANVEEYHEASDLFLGVVWFENPQRAARAR